MKTLQRWAKFNAVGLLGAGFQLGTLAVLNRWFPHHYLYTSAVAVELTLLHNFLWHLHYTWKDRTRPANARTCRRSIRAARLQQCLRFHLSNGLVSLLGNVTLLRLLVSRAHLRLIPASLLTILCCSGVNFFLGNRLVFR